MKKAVYPVLLVIFTMVLTSITSSQAIPSQTTFYACVKKSSGEIKMTTASKKCTKGSNKINWNNTGPQGTDGLDAIYLSASDFENIWDSPATFGTPNMGGWSRPAWILSGNHDSGMLLISDLPKPAGWETVEEVNVTFYWAASASDGDVLLEICFSELKVGENITTCGYDTGTYFDTPQTNELISSNANFGITPGDSLLEIGIERYMFDGGSSTGDDTNSGNVYVLGAKIEPITE